MIVRYRRASLVLSAMVVMSAAVADANGINPPRVKGASVVTASCLERATRSQREFLRARIRAGGQSFDVLSLRVGDTTEDVPIRDIASIRLAGTPIDRDGFLAGSFMRRDAQASEPIAVSVRTSDAAVRLAGFSKAGSPVTIELAKCEQVDFGEALPAETPPPPPVMRK